MPKTLDTWIHLEHNDESNNEIDFKYHANAVNPVCIQGYNTQTKRHDFIYFNPEALDVLIKFVHQIKPNDHDK